MQVNYGYKVVTSPLHILSRQTLGALSINLLNDIEPGADAVREMAFAAEVARLRELKVVGVSGRMRDMFDFLADRGFAAEPANQADIALGVFGQTATDSDDATVRVYVHRLRKRLEEFYASNKHGDVQLTVPAGIYALRLADEETSAGSLQGTPKLAWNWTKPRKVTAIAAALLGAILVGYLIPPGTSVRVNAFWQPIMSSDRPIAIVVGDYYIFGEIDPVRPEEGRLIRDFRIDSPADLTRMQEQEPGRYANAEDVGLNYLPFSAAHAMREIMPILAATDRPVRTVPASGLDAEMLRDNDIVYIGLISAMGLLEELTFARSSLEVGESYDELSDNQTGQSYISEEARRLAAPVFYRDYGYVARFRSAGGGLVMIVAGARETALRAVAPSITAPELSPDILALARKDGGMEVLYQVTGQQGADLNSRVILARPQP